MCSWTTSSHFVKVLPAAARPCADSSCMQWTSFSARLPSITKPRSLFLSKNSAMATVPGPPSKQSWAGSSMLWQRPSPCLSTASNVSSHYWTSSSQNRDAPSTSGKSSSASYASPLLGSLAPKGCSPSCNCLYSGSTNTAFASPPIFAAIFFATNSSFIPSPSDLLAWQKSCRTNRQSLVLPMLAAAALAASFSPLRGHRASGDIASPPQSLVTWFRLTTCPGTSPTATSNRWPAFFTWTSSPTLMTSAN